MSRVAGIRAAVRDDARGIARVHVESWRSTYRGRFPARVLADLSVEGREAQWLRQLDALDDGTVGGCVAIAEEVDGRIVGFASGGPEREVDAGFDGELYALYLLEDRQRRGIGRALARHVVAHLQQAGFGSMRVWVLKGNPAEGFYARMGGTCVGEKSLQIGGADVVEVAYGWRSLADFDP